MFRPLESTVVVPKVCHRHQEHGQHWFTWTGHWVWHWIVDTFGCVRVVEWQENNVVRCTRQSGSKNKLMFFLFFCFFFVAAHNLISLTHTFSFYLRGQGFKHTKIYKYKTSLCHNCMFVIVYCTTKKEFYAFFCIYHAEIKINPKL